MSFSSKNDCEALIVAFGLQQIDANKNKAKGGWQQKSKGTKKMPKSKKKKPLKKKPTAVPLPQAKQQKQKQANGVVGNVSLLSLFLLLLRCNLYILNCSNMYIAPKVHA